jgi:hypothetical protein
MNKKLLITLIVIFISFIIFSGKEQEQVKSQKNTTHSPITYLKKEPSFDSLHVEVINSGVKLEPLESKKIDGFKWQKVEYNGKTGWVTENLINKN